MSEQPSSALRLLYAGDASNTLLWKEWALSLHQKGWDVTVWGELPPADTLPFPIVAFAQSQALGLRIIKQFLRKGLSFRTLRNDWSALDLFNGPSLKHLLYTMYAFSYSKEFTNKLSQKSFDIIHLHYLYQPATLAFLNIHSPLPPIIYSTWGSDLFIEPNRTRLRYRQFCQLLEIVRLVHTESEHQARYLRQTFKYSGEILVHSWGIDIDEIHQQAALHPPDFWRNKLNIKPGTQLIVSARKLENNYRISVLLKAFSHLKGSYPDQKWHIVIASFGREYQALLRITKELGLDSVVTFTGKLPSSLYYSLIAQSDIYVQYPLSDGISQTLLQAMALKTICFTSTAGDNRYLIEDTVNGFLCEDSTPSKLAGVLSQILSLTDREKEKIAEKAHHTVQEHHSREKRVSFFSRLYQRLA